MGANSNLPQSIKAKRLIPQQEDAKTPSKREGKTKLKEMKSKRRWSNIELAELQQQLQHMQATYLLNTEKLEYNFRVLNEK